MDAFVQAMEDADQAMQRALKVAPEAGARATTETFRAVRATLVMAHEMKRAEERRG